MSEKNKNKNILFGLNPTDAAATALARTLWKTSYFQGNPGKVNTKMGGSCADYNQRHQAWVLHNEAWWGHGGAHGVIRFAAERLEKSKAEFSVPTELWGEVEMVQVGGDKLVPKDEVSPYQAVVWAVAQQSYAAWKAHQKRVFYEKGAQIQSMELDLFRLVWERSYFNNFVPVYPEDFARELVAEFGGEIALQAAIVMGRFKRHLQVGADFPFADGDGNFSELGKAYIPAWITRAEADAAYSTPADIKNYWGAFGFCFPNLPLEKPVAQKYLHAVLAAMKKILAFSKDSHVPEIDLLQEEAHSR